MKRYLLRALTIGLTLSISIIPAPAADPVRLDPVVVTATKSPKKLENVPAVVTVIGPEEIEAIPARTVGDLLADLPGVYPYEPQGVGLVTPQSVTLRGIGFPGHTLILLDGQKINTPFTDYAYLTTIPVRAVDRIEVIRGNFSALYGSSAGGGIINIITKDGGDRPYVSPWGQAGNFGRYDAGVDGGLVWKDFSLGLFYDHKQVDNYFLYDDKGLDDTNRDYEHDRFHAKLTGALGDLTRFSLSGGLVDGDTGFGVGENLGAEPRQDILHGYLNLIGESYLTENLDLRVQLDWFGSDHEYAGETLTGVRMVNVGPPPPLPPVMAPQFMYRRSVNDTSADRWRADVMGNINFGEERILTLGTEAVYTAAEKGIRDPDTGQPLPVQGREGNKIDESETLYSLYAQYDWTFFRNFELVLGARFDDYESYGSEFSPKGAFRWHYAEGGNLKLSVGKGFKAPNLNQLYSPPWSIAPFIVYQGNPDLEAETLWSYELSLEQRGLEDRLFVRLTPYYTEADDFITSVRFPDPLNPGGQLMQPENVDEVEIQGVDVEISYRLLRGLTAFLSYTYNETRDDKTDEILDGYPRNTASLGFRGGRLLSEDWRVFGSYAARYRGEYDTTGWGAPPVTETVGDYWFHTAALGLEWKEMVTLSADLFNLCDDRSKSDIDRYLPEFNYLVGMSFRYEF
ncbi:MAG: TonB-dependent receptor plug domain-containing protein [Thermodesulfobacteriota bacterium]